MIHFRSLQRLRETLILVLLVALPLHAFAVTVLTKMIAGPGHAPLGEIALWKEGVLGIILLMALWEIVMRGIRNKEVRIMRIDTVDMLIILLCVIAIAMLPVSRTSLSAQLLGIKYDFIPLIAFFLLRRVQWSETFFSRTSSVLYAVASIIALYGIASFFLPMSFFTALGYSDLHSLYVPSASLAPFQQIGGSALRRIQSVMSGPNQLGLWLLIPWSIGLVQLLPKWKGQWPVVCGQCLLFAALLLTFSRAAWIGAAIIVVVALWRAPFPLPRWKKVRVMGVVLVAACCLGIAAYLLFPNVVLRAASSRDHLLRPLKAIQMMVADPLGRGLGSAGPASNRVSDACVELEAGADASWAADRPDLCVFVGGEQVQPTGRTCRCPVLPENWYLQMGVELGVAGMIVFALLMIAVLRALNMEHEKWKMKNTIFLLLLALAVAALVLHAFEDAAVAWTAWILAAMALSYSQQQTK